VRVRRGVRQRAAGVQAVADGGGQGEGDTELDRKARLRGERAGSLAYDAEQQQLRDSLLATLHSSPGDASAGEGDDGLRLRRRAPAEAEVRPLTYSSLA
jgi:hypothetical protein